MAGKTFWKIVTGMFLFLSILIFTMFILNRGTKSTDSKKQSSGKYISDLENNSVQQAVQDPKSNDLFYENYDSISKLSDEQRRKFGVVRLKQDSLISLDFDIRIKVRSGSFLQKNYDDSLRIAIKEADNTSIFCHSYDSHDDLLTNLKSIKRKFKIENLFSHDVDTDVKYVEYNLNKNKDKFYGFALLMLDYHNFVSLEYENKSLPKDELEVKAYGFLKQIVKDSR